MPIIPMDSIPDSNVAPESSYTLTVESFDAEITEESDYANAPPPGLLQEVLVWVIPGPEGFRGRKRFVLGTPDDPECKDPAGDWVKNKAAQQLKKFLVAIGYEGMPDTDKIRDEIKGSTFDADIGIFTPPGGGNPVNTINRFYPAGVRVNGNGAQPPQAHVAPPRATPPQAQRQPVAQQAQRATPPLRQDGRVRPGPRASAVQQAEE